MSEIIPAAEVIRPESITRPVVGLSIEADGIAGFDVRQTWSPNDGPDDVVIEISPFDPYADSDDDEEEQGAYVHGTEIRVRGNTDRLALTLALRQLADTLDPKGAQS
jgi:hypothetical protein